MAQRWTGGAAMRYGTGGRCNAFAARQRAAHCAGPVSRLRLTAGTTGRFTGHKLTMGTFAAIWGVLGVVLLLASAVYRLSFPALETFSHDLHSHHWMAIAVNIVFMGYAEGYRGFQQGFSPRVAARARYLRNHPQLVHALLAPLFCMGYFHAVRRRKIVSFSLTAGIVLLVVVVRLLPQPWRGIVDLGVVLGLSWGLVSVAPFAIRAFTDEDFDYSPDVPGS